MVGSFIILKVRWGSTKLNPKQIIFIEEYITNGNNATLAYTKAGYKAKGNVATVNASRLLTNANIKAEIDKRLAKATAKFDITVESILMRLDAMADKTTAKDTDRIKALELLGKYRKLFTDRTELSGSIDVGVNIIDDI